MAAFDKARVSYVKVSSVLPGYAKDEDKYRLVGDGHPNALADHLLGQYLAQHLDEIPAQPTN